MSSNGSITSPNATHVGHSDRISPTEQRPPGQAVSRRLHPASLRSAVSSCAAPFA